MSLFRNLLGNGADRPPAPEVASPDEVEQYNLRYIKANEPDPARTSTSDPMMASPYAAEDRNVTYKSEFPWLFEPERGSRWDFNPIELRNLGQENTWVGMLIQSITKEISETPWTITKPDGQADLRKRAAMHPEQRPVAKEFPDATAEQIADLLQDPNPDHDWQDFIEMAMADLLEIGSAAAVKAFPEAAYDEENQLTREADTLRPRAMMPSAPEVWTKGYQDKTGLVDAYWQFDRQRAPGSGQSEGGTAGTRGFRTPIRFDTAEVAWTDMTPRTNRRYGMPPTLIVKDFLESVDMAVKQEQQYLSKGSIPSGAWVFEEWDRERLREWKDENEENIRGKPHKSLLFAGEGGDVRYEAMSMNFQELEFTERMKWYARVIASVFQVPTAVVGIEPERVNYNTFQGERENFEENTLGPYLQKLERWLNSELIRPHWGDDYHFEFKPGVSETTRAARSDRVQSEFQSELVTRAEARRELGYDVDDERDDGVFHSDVAADEEGDAEALLANAADQLAKESDDSFTADIFRLRLPDDHDREGFEDDIVGIGVDFPNDAVYVDWRNDVFPDALENSHVSIYGSVDDLQRATDNVVEPIDSLDALAESELAASVVKAACDSGNGNGGAVAKETFEDYPEAAVENAQMALDARDDTGNPNDCGQREGWARANQLANREPISRETVGRMAAFARHEDNSDQGDAGRADCGWMMWNAWGGDEGIAWAQRQVEANSIERDASACGCAVAKDDALRNTDDWAAFDIQPGMVEELTADINEPIGELFDEIMADEDVAAVIDRLAAPDNADEIDKSVGELGRILRDKLTDLDVTERIADAIRERSTTAAERALRRSIEETDEDVTIDIERVTAQLQDRDVSFADRFAEQVSEDIRETVGEGWAEGKNSREIAEDIADQADMSAGWTGAERIARQEMHVAAGEARSEFAAEIDKVEVWQHSGDYPQREGARESHAEMTGRWKHPEDDWEVDYAAEGGPTVKESTPGDSKYGIGCRCQVQLRDQDAVDADDYAGDSSP